MKYQRSSKGVVSISIIFQDCFKSTSWIFKWVSRLIGECQGCLKEVKTMFQESFKGIFKKVSNKFHGRFRIFSRVPQESIREVLLSKFVMEWQSSQQPEHKGGLFII